jgi:hypothetical protein
VIVNLTPHPIRLYGFGAPDRFNLGDHEPIEVIEPSGKVARLGENELGTTRVHDVPVELVEYRPYKSALPDPDPLGTGYGTYYGTYYVVSLVLALALNRGDLLVPYREIRNHDGTVIGARILARPV